MDTAGKLPTRPTLELEPIAFSRDDAAGVTFPHHDPRVITAEIAHYEVALLFMDAGSSINIIFLSAFR